MQSTTPDFSEIDPKSKNHRSRLHPFAPFPGINQFVTYLLFHCNDGRLAGCQKVMGAGGMKVSI